MCKKFISFLLLANLILCRFILVNPCNANEVLSGNVVKVKYNDGLDYEVKNKQGTIQLASDKVIFNTKDVNLEIAYEQISGIKGIAATTSSKPLLKSFAWIFCSGIASLALGSVVAPLFKENATNTDAKRIFYLAPIALVGTFAPSIFAKDVLDAQKYFLLLTYVDKSGIPHSLTFITKNLLEQEKVKSMIEAKIPQKI